jgi:tetratricopeptide (TPR) repeat protein
VLENLWQELKSETETFLRRPGRTPEEADREALEEFIEDLSRLFIGRSDQLGSTLDFIHSPPAEGKPWALCITGPSGVGKSAFFARVHRELETDSSLLLLSHATGVGTRSMDVDITLRRWITELNHTLPQNEQEAPLLADAKPEEIDRVLGRLLHRAARSRRIAVLLDAPNQFLPVPRSRYFSWLPKPWPPNARLLVTTLPGTESEALARLSGALTEPLRPLEEQESIELARAVSRRYHREFHPDVIATVISHRLPDGTLAAGNPLWLTLAMEQINLLDADDLARAENEYKGRPEERLHQLLLNVAASLPQNVEGLYGWLLKQNEQVHGKVWVNAFASAIALSRLGWRESDLLDLVPRLAQQIDPDIQCEKFEELRLAALRRSFRAHLVQRGARSQWDFFHTQARAAVLHRHAESESIQKRQHSAIADYLDTLPLSDPQRHDEMMWHLIGSGDIERTARFYGELPTPLGTRHDPATLTLAEHLLAETAEEQKRRLDWVSSILSVKLSPHVTNSICNRFQFDLNDRLEYQSPLSIRKQLLERVQNVLAGLCSRYPKNVGFKRDFSINNSKIGDVLHAQGDLSGALSAYRQSLKMSNRLAKIDPSNATWQHDLSTSHTGIGDILREQGDLSGALSAYRHSLAVSKRLANADPSNTRWQRDLYISHSKIGDILHAQGDLSNALSAYLLSLEVSEQLANADPSNTGWQRDLSISQDRVGDVLREQGNLSSALSAYRESLAVREQLANVDPSNSGWQSDLSISQDRVGDVLRDKGYLARALSAYRQSLAIRERLANLDPSNTGWQRDLYISRSKVGEVLYAQGDLASALSAYRLSLEVNERLAISDPSNARWQNDLYVSHIKVGDVLYVQGDLSGALSAYRHSLAVSERLATTDPSNTRWQRDFYISHSKVGDVLHAQGDLSGALSVYRKNLTVSERLANSDPSNALWQSDLSVSYVKVGDVLREQGDPSGALSSYRQSVVIRERLANVDPSNIGWQRGLYISQSKVGDIMRDQGDIAGALSAYRQCLAVSERLAKVDPLNAGWQRDLWVSYWRLADILERSGKNESINWWNRALTVLVSMKQKGLFVSPDDEKALNILRQKCS